MKKIFYGLATLTFLASSVYANGQFNWKLDLNENLTRVRQATYLHQQGPQLTGTDEVTNWPDIGPNGEAGGTLSLPYSRIPSMVITNDNKIVVMFDLRWVENGTDGHSVGSDHGRIDPGVAISEDGGHTCVRKTAWNFNESRDRGRRTMDSTMIYNPINDETLVMHGAWKGGTQNWYRDRINYYNRDLWSAPIHKSTDGGYTWEKVTEFSKNNNADVYSVFTPDVNPVVGFLGGVGTGLVMPIQTAHRHDGNSWRNPKGLIITSTFMILKIIVKLGKCQKLMSIYNIINHH